MGKLTATQIRSLKEPGRYHDGDGLMLNVSKGGSASWLLRLQDGGRRREYGLGALKKVSLAEARGKADAVRRQLAAGLDPVTEKKKAAKLVPTFSAAAAAVHSEQKKTWRNGKHQDQWLNSLKTYVFPALGHHLVDAIDAPMVRDVLLPIWLDKPETARRVCQRIGVVLDWAFANGHRPSELTMRAVSRGLPRQPARDGHFAALPYDQVPSFVGKIEQRESVGRLALLALIFTCARSGEIRGATWKEVDLEQAIWTIPASRMKAGREHRIPLSKRALEVFGRAAELRRDGCDLVFPGQKRNSSLSDMTLTKVLRDMDSACTAHGFRSSFRDWAAENTQFPDSVCEAALAHKVADKTVAAYRRTDFFEKRRELMEAWSNFISDSSPDVIRLSDRRVAR